MSEYRNLMDAIRILTKATARIVIDEGYSPASDKLIHAMMYLDEQAKKAL